MTDKGCKRTFSPNPQSCYTALMKECTDYKDMQKDSCDDGFAAM